MYVLTFNRVEPEKPKEEYYYKELKSAWYHLGLFVNDDSNLYRSISILDSDTDTVLAILVFEENSVKTQLYILGDKVKIKQEFATEKERHFEYQLVNINENTFRADIKCLSDGLPLHAVETVSIHMLESDSHQIPLS